MKSLPLSSPMFVFPPPPYLFFLFVKDEDCEALFPLLLLQNSWDASEVSAGSIW